MNVTGKSLIAALAMLFAGSAGAQEARMRMPNPDAAPTPPGVPRNSQFPYEGAWEGRRIMPGGSDDVTIRFLVQNDKYLSSIAPANGRAEPERAAQATSAGLSWQQPNSGGGTWLYKVHFASPDSLVGTLVLTNAPANLTPAPAGTLSLRRVAAKAAGASRR